MWLLIMNLLLAVAAAGVDRQKSEPINIVKSIPEIPESIGFDDVFYTVTVDTERVFENVHHLFESTSTLTLQIIESLNFYNKRIFTLRQKIDKNFNTLREYTIPVEIHEQSHNSEPEHVNICDSTPLIFKMDFSSDSDTENRVAAIDVPNNATNTNSCVVM